MSSRSRGHVYRRLIAVGDIFCADHDYAPVAGLSSQAATSPVPPGATVSAMAPQLAVLTVSAFAALSSILALSALSPFPAGSALGGKGYKNGNRIHLYVQGSSVSTWASGPALPTLNTRSARAPNLGAIVIDPIAVGIVARDPSPGRNREIESLSSR